MDFWTFFGYSDREFGKILQFFYKNSDLFEKIASSNFNLNSLQILKILAILN